MNVFMFTLGFVALVLDANESLAALTKTKSNKEDVRSARVQDLFTSTQILDTLALMSNTLNNYRFSCPVSPLSNDLGYWIKP